MPAANFDAVRAAFTAMPRKVALRLRSNRFVGTPN
jgi:hypothetical protein